MPRFFCLSFFIALLVTGCSDSNNNFDNEAQFYGLWSKGSKVGDTLQFMRKGNKDILRYNMSFNASLPTYTEVEYRYINGKLAVERFGAGSGVVELESFAWTRAGKEFTILGYQLYLIMSSTATRFTYVKID